MSIVGTGKVSRAKLDKEDMKKLKAERDLQTRKLRSSA